MPSAAEQYAAMLDAVDEQQLRLFGPRPRRHLDRPVGGPSSVSIPAAS